MKITINSKLYYDTLYPIKMLPQNKMIPLKLNLQKAFAIPPSSLTVNNYFLHPVYLSQANILPF